MSLRELPFNDIMAQCTKKLIKVSKEDEEKRINEIKNCNHLFVKLRDYNTSTYDNLDLSVVECVHCGVTNKYHDLERVMQKYRKSLDYYVLTHWHYTDVEYNEVTIESMMMDKIKDENKELNMISNEVLRSPHPGVLYKVAKMINKDAENEELFEIMKKLNQLETFEEKNKLNSVEEATDLIERYKEEIKVLRK